MSAPEQYVQETPPGTDVHPDDSHGRGSAPFAATRRPRSTSLTAWVVATALLMSLPLFVESYSLSTFTVGLVYLVAAVNLNVALGYAGEFVLHFPVVLGVGAYGTAVSSATFGWASIPSILVGTALGTVVSVILCLPGLKVRGFYLGVIGLFAVFTFPDFVSLLSEWTGGEDGLAGLQVPVFFDSPVDGRGWYWIIAAVFLVSVAWTYSLATSSWGLRARAMRDAKYAGRSSGLNETRTRITIYVVSSIPVAFAGCVFAFEKQFVVPDTFSIELALLLLAGVIIGGKGTVLGPVIGTALLLVFEMWVGEFSLWSPVVYGTALLVGSILVPNGLVSLLTRVVAAPQVRRLTRSRSAPANSSTKSEAAASPRSFLEDLRDHQAEATNVANGPLLELTQVGKSFFGTSVLQGVDLTLETGKVIGLVGPNGSGKSTLLNIVAGVLAPDHGTVTFGGRDLRGLPHHKYAQIGIGRSFQVPQLIDECSARENVELGLLYEANVGFVSDILRTGRSRRLARERRRDADLIVELLSLGEGASTHATGSLPLGTKRVLEIGRAIALRPRLVLLDEPTAGLNPEERRAVGEFVLAICEAGITVLVVEHNVPFVLEFCDEVVLLDQGSILSRGSTRETLSPALDAYLRYGVPSEEDAQEDPI